MAVGFSIITLRQTLSEYMMKFLITVISLAFIGSTQAVANGTVEVAHSSPWQAKTYFYADIASWGCGGTLISHNYVLVTARCLTYQNEEKAVDIEIFLGAYDIQNSDEEGRIQFTHVSVEQMIIHKDYNATTHENDIALIKLPSSVNFSDTIQPSKLATKRSVQLGDVSRISGWQYPFSEFVPNHQYPHGGDVSVVENSACQETYPSYVIDDDTICASGGVAFCYGDEGLPFSLNDEVVAIGYGAKDVLVPSEECPILPQTYLSIPKYLDWIKANSDYQDN